MNAWEITLIVMNALGLGMALAKHGEPMGEWNFFHRVLATALCFFIYYKAGLFQ